jgi:hypothetical protein
MSVWASQNVLLKSQGTQEQKDNDNAQRSMFAVVNGVWPISNSETDPDELSSPFGPRNLAPTYPYDFHDGVDIRTLDFFGNPTTGKDVHAFYNGTVSAKGTFTTRSGAPASFVRIQHQDPNDLDYFWTEYVHVEMDAKYDALTPGITTVTKGQHILESGAVGTATPHLHFNGLTYPNPTILPPSPLPDREIDAINPMRTDGLNYTNANAPRLGPVTYSLSPGQSFVEFEVFTPDNELDLNEIYLRHNSDEVYITFDGPRGTRRNTDALNNTNSDGSPGNEDGSINAKTSSNNSISIQITTFSFNPSDTEQKLRIRYTNLPSSWSNVNNMEACAIDTKGLYDCVPGSAFVLPGGITDEEALPTNFAVLQNFPNPFNPSTTIRFALPEKSVVSLAIFDMRGGLVRELASQQFYEQGWKELSWDGNNAAGQPVASGMYYYRLNVRSNDDERNFSQTRKMLLVR